MKWVGTFVTTCLLCFSSYAADMGQPKISDLRNHPIGVTGEFGAAVQLKKWEVVKTLIAQKKIALAHKYHCEESCGCSDRYCCHGCACSCVSCCPTECAVAWVSCPSCEGCGAGLVSERVYKSTCKKSCGSTCYCSFSGDVCPSCLSGCGTCAADTAYQLIMRPCSVAKCMGRVLFGGQQVRKEIRPSTMARVTSAVCSCASAVPKSIHLAIKHFGEEGELGVLEQLKEAVYLNSSYRPVDVAHVLGMLKRYRVDEHVWINHRKRVDVFLQDSTPKGVQDMSVAPKQKVMNRGAGCPAGGMSERATAPRASSKEESKSAELEMRLTDSELALVKDRADALRPLLMKKLQFCMMQVV